MNKRRLRTLLSAIMAGIFIGIGGTAYLITSNKIVGSILFTVGLFTICTFNFHLFTGKLCYMFEKDKNYRLDIPIIWLGNLIGTFVTAKLLSFTRINEVISNNAKEICNIKLNDSYISLFILAIFCNILIYLAVDGYNNNKHDIGKYLSLFFGVIVFILCGFEHSVADMYYFSIANVWNIKTLFVTFIISFGNIVGGLLIPILRKIKEG